MKDKDVRFDPTNAVIVDNAGKIVQNGIHPRCPHCGAALLHNRNAVGIWRVGSVVKWECCLCRNQYHAVEIPVPEGMEPEVFYEKIRKALAGEED